jgi:hypothetical protein
MSESLPGWGLFPQWNAKWPDFQHSGSDSGGLVTPMSLYVRVFSSFYDHRKTIRLRAMIGDDAFWVPPRLWAYAAERRPDGCFKDYTAGEIAYYVGYTKDAQALLQALLQAGFLDSDPLRIHDWDEHNGYHKTYADRAAAAAKARWEKKKEKGNERKGEKQCLGGNEAMLEASKASPVDVFEQVRGRICTMFKRPPVDRWDYVEESALAEVCRRPAVMNELTELERFKARPDSYFPQSVSRLITGWAETLDRSRNANTNQRTSKPLNDRNAGTANNPSDYANPPKGKVI